MIKRILTAFVGVPILLVLIYIGGIPFAVFTGFLVAMGTYEYGKMVEKNHVFLFWSVLFCEGIMLLTMYLGWRSWASVGLMAAFLLIFIHAVIYYPKITVVDIGINFLALLYIGWTYPHLIAIERLPYGTMMLFYVFIAIWSSDTGAYFAGRFFGRHKLAPLVSPNKTIEGSIGGIVTTIVVLFLMNQVLKLFSGIEIVGLAIILSVIGQIGDLVESMLKRFFGIKDSGNLLPGHGGILDRFDSLMMAAPFLYYFVIVMTVLGYRI